MTKVFLARIFCVWELASADPSPEIAALSPNMFSGSSHPTRRTSWNGRVWRRPWRIWIRYRRPHSYCLSCCIVEIDFLDRTWKGMGVGACTTIWIEICTTILSFLKRINKNYSKLPVHPARIFHIYSTLTASQHLRRQLHTSPPPMHHHHQPPPTVYWVKLQPRCHHPK